MAAVRRPIHCVCLDSAFNIYLHHRLQENVHYGCGHRGSTGPAEPLLRTTATLAAANFIVITNGEGSVNSVVRLLEQPISTNSVPRAFFPRVAIGCRLSLKIDRNLEGLLSVAT